MKIYNTLLLLLFTAGVLVVAKGEEDSYDSEEINTDLYHYEESMYDVADGHDMSADEEDFEEHDFDLYFNNLDHEDLSDSSEDELVEEENADWFLNDEEVKCRDDSNMKCDEVMENGDCALNKTGLLAKSVRNLCPVTCGLCKADHNALWTENDCFQYNEDIHIFFNSKEPENYDFIGIYPAHYDFKKNPELLLKALLWLTTCGSLHEYCKAAKGGLLFGGIGPSDETNWNFFPMPPGKYKAVLARGDDPHELIIESEPFKAKAEGHSCYSDCEDMVYTDSVCYNYQKDSIHITFENCEPNEEDLIAIYQHGEVPGEQEPLLWLGTCGRQDCLGEVAYDILLFGPKTPDESARGSWPLPPGDYSAHLMKYMPEKQHGIPSAQSNFQVRHSCDTSAF